MAAVAELARPNVFPPQVTSPLELSRGVTMTPMILSTLAGPDTRTPLQWARYVNVNIENYDILNSLYMFGNDADDFISNIEISSCLR